MEESQLQNSKSDNFWSFLSCYFFQLRRHITNFFDCSLWEQTREKSTYSFCRRLSKNCLFYTSFFLCFITVVQCAIATTFGLGGRKGWKILSKSCIHCLPRVQKECRIGFLIGSLQYLFSTWDVFYLYLFCFKFIKLDSNVQLPHSYSRLLDCLEKSCGHCLSNVQGIIYQVCWYEVLTTNFSLSLSKFLPFLYHLIPSSNCCNFYLGRQKFLKILSKIHSHCLLLRQRHYALSLLIWHLHFYTS